MHVILISQSTGKSLQRTRSIIDRFAIRFGTDTWMTPITNEALSGLRKDLIQSVSREMSVACYRNFGMQKMILLWTVGSRKSFGEYGGVAIATKSVKETHHLPYVKVIEQLARLSGFTHDIGKMNAFFQEKLQLKNAPKTLGDPVRHEWLSGILLDSVWENKPINLKKAKRLFKSPLSCCDPKTNSSSWNLLESLRWSIITHHHMAAGSIDNPDHSRHWKYPNKDKNTPQSLSKESVFESYKDALLPDRILKSIQNQKLYLIQNALKDWRGAAIIARASLTWADHYFSSIPQEKTDNEVLRANTFAQQSLQNHLAGVGGYASKISSTFFDAQFFSGCTPQSMESINQSSDPESRFNWQNIAVDFLSNLPQNRPTLIFNLGGTGSGKTRANMRCLLACASEDRPFRVTSVFNLRTLTVQTHHAYQKELNIEEGDLACIVGDPLVKKLNDIEKSVALEDDDEFLEVEETEYQVEGGETDVFPDWFEKMRTFDSGLIPLLAPPVLVSTIDYIIAAGDFSDMRHHASALMRVAHSDLILDEVDGYDPAALASVCRVVLMSALFGRHVIASSATLSEPVANALKKAFETGCEIRSGMIDKSVSAQYVFLDDKTYPSVSGEDDFNPIYDQHVEKMMDAIHESVVNRRYQSIDIENDHIKNWAEKIDQVSLQLHANHHFEWDGIRVSVGLVRMANVRPCVQISRLLADKEKNGLFVTSYHASDMTLRRAMKEQKLDRILTRKASDKNGYNPNQSIMDEPEIQALHHRAKKAGVQDIRFMVIATPVEEVGRDHDFDWAILEPSSAQSIVQAAGRVNRHRMIPVMHPNIAVFERNLRSFKNKDVRKTEFPSFKYPGYEVNTELLYGYCAMKDLLQKNHNDPVHAGWRIGNQRTLFAQKDDAAICKYMEDALKIMDKPWAWHSPLLNKYALRKRSGMYAHIFRYDQEDDIMWYIQKSQEINAYQQGYTKNMDFSNYGFFCPKLEDVIQYAEEIGEDEKIAQRFSVTMRSDLKPIHFDLQFGGYKLS